MRSMSTVSVAVGKSAYVFCAVTLAAAFAQSPAVGPRITPPTLNAVEPRGVAQGSKVEMTIEGLNLADATAVYFSQPGLKATILGVKELPDLSDIRLGANGTTSTVDLGPLPPRNQVRVQLEVAADAPIGPVALRVQTPLGTSPVGRFLVEPHYSEVAAQGMNGSPEGAAEAKLPAILTGTIARQGETDYFKIHASANQQLVFENDAENIGSMLQPVVTILREDRSVLKELGRDGMWSASAFAYTFDKDGTYYIKVADFAEQASPAHFYRYKVGDFSLATMAFPLGFRRGEAPAVTVSGYNLQPSPVTPDLKNVHEIRAANDDLFLYRPPGAKGESFWNVKLGVWDDAELISKGTNTSLANAAAISVPSTANGILDGKTDGRALGHYYKFHAKKDEHLVFEIAAHRLGSDLDSKLEVLDAKGKQIERATVRAILATNLTLRDHGSTDRGIRLASTAGLDVGDLIMIGNEIDRVEEVPRTPDADTMMENFAQQRITFYGTTPEAHAIDQPAYKVRMYEPGRKFTPNGLPLVHLFYQNDDGGAGFDRDSYLEFTAPSDGDYYVRVSDTRGQSGSRFAYRLNIRPPRPDFRLSLSPDNPNIPLGGAVPVEVTALRLDGFNGPISLSVSDLPAGVHATNGAIAQGQTSGTILLMADSNAAPSRAVQLKVEGHATDGNRALAHSANPNDALTLLSLMPKSDISVQTPTKVVEVEPGGSADVSVALVRQNGFRGRVPVSVWNLPPEVRVANIGLNGVLITETQTQRAFKLECLPNAQPMEQIIYVAGDIETRSPLQSSYAAPQPILLRVKPKPSQVASTR